MTKLLKLLLPFICIILVWAVFSRQTILNQKVPLAADITVGMYYPWLDGGKVPVKNPILTDTVSQFWIWRQWSLDTLKNGRLAFWNPYLLSGTAQSPWFHTILFSPANLIYFILPKLTAISYIILLQLFLGLLFSYLFFNQIVKNKTIALFGAISFSFSSYFIGWLTWGTVSWTLAFIPISLLGIEMFFDHQTTSLKALFIIFVSNIFAFLGGHPQTYLYYLIIVLSFFAQKIIQADYRKKSIKDLLVVFCLSFISLSFILLPSLRIINDSIRSQDQYIKTYNYGFVSPLDIVVSSISPSFFGNPATNNYWGSSLNYQEKLFWFGIIPFMFAIAWVISFIKNRHRTKFDWWLVGLFLTGIFLSLKYPFGILVYWLKIPFISTSPAGRGLILSIFSLVIMSQLGLKQVIKSEYYYIKKAIIFVGVLIAALYIYTMYLQFTNVDTWMIAFRNLSLSTIFFASAATIIYISHKTNRRIALLIIPICLIDLLLFADKYTPFTPQSYYFPQNNLLESLKPNSQEFYRVEREKSELLPPNMWQMYGLPSSQGYDPMVSLNYTKYLISRDLIKSPTRFIEWQKKDLTKLDDLGIKYFLTLKRDLNNNISDNGKIDPVIDQKKWKIATESGSVAVLENQNFKPPFFLTTPGKLTLTSKTDKTWTFETETATESSLILLENNHPNWHAQIDDHPVSIENFRNTFKQVIIPTGKHRIFLYFQDSLFKIGLLISTTSTITFFIFLFLTKKHERK